MTATADSKGVLTDEQVQFLILSTISSNGSASEDQLYKVCQWANGVVVENTILEAIFTGDMEITFRKEDDELMFGLTKKGIATTARLEAAVIP